MDKITAKVANLLTVKSLVTLCLTIVFAVLSVNGQINQNFMTIYAVIIAFYFGTQSQKNQDVLDDLDSIITGGAQYAKLKAAMEDRAAEE